MFLDKGISDHPNFGLPILTVTKLSFLKHFKLPDIDSIFK